MARQVFVWRDGHFIEIDTKAPRPERKFPYIKCDSMPLTEHPVNGRYYDSKSEFNRVAKSLGYEDRTGERQVASGVTDIPIEVYEQAVAESWEQVEANTAPLDENDRELCKVVNETIKSKYGSDK